MSKLRLTQAFKDEMEAGYVSEERLIRHITNAVTTEDNDYSNKFNIADILNGRVNENRVQMSDVQKMVKRWNKALGVCVILEEFV